MIISFHGIIPSTQSLPSPLLTDLIAYYDMDETSGTTMFDSHTGGYDGTIYNGPTLNGSDYTFDGINDYVLIPDNDVFSFTDEVFTIQLWWKTSFTGGVRFPLYKSSGGSTFEYAANNAGSGFIFSGTYNPNQALSTSPYLWDGSYHHWVFQGDGSTLRLYVDGALEASSSITVSMVNASSGVNIARYGGGTNYFPGEMKLIGFWDRALNATEVSDLYNSGSGLTYANL
jgi:hypothetical protein